MKRVFLDVGETVPAAIALVRFAVDAPRGRRVGDPVHEWVTEGRRKQYEIALVAGAEWAIKLSKTGGYSSCGDLAHWLLMCLGVRDERYVNRSDDGGQHPWIAGVNISRLVALPAYVKAAAGLAPKPGDITHVAGPDHVAVCELFDPDAGESSSYDYGQPYGANRKRVVVQRGATWIIGGRVLQGWVDIERVKLVESAIVPDDFKLGELDENPYAEAISIPSGIG